VAVAVWARAVVSACYADGSYGVVVQGSGDVLNVQDPNVLRYLLTRESERRREKEEDDDEEARGSKGMPALPATPLYEAARLPPPPQSGPSQAPAPAAQNGAEPQALADSACSLVMLVGHPTSADDEKNAADDDAAPTPDEETALSPPAPSLFPEPPLPTLLDFQAYLSAAPPRPPPVDSEVLAAGGPWAEAAGRAWLSRVGASAALWSASGSKPVHAAAAQGEVCALAWLLASGVAPGDLRACNDDKLTPAHWAASHGHLSCLRFLASRGGADLLRAKGHKGRTPYHCAAAQGHVEVVAWLHSCADAKHDLAAFDR
jgi:hypothetical protein